MMRSRFQTFVGLRYLMAHPLHVSWLALGMAAVCAVAAAALYGVQTLVLVAPSAPTRAVRSTSGEETEGARKLAAIRAELDRMQSGKVGA
jgi:hypothetical protein